MPELQHYTTWEEAIALLREVMERHGLVAIPEEPILSRPHLDRYEHCSPELVEKLSRFPVVLLEGTFTKHPLEFGRRENGTAAGTYYVTEASGPRMVWTLPRVTRDSTPRLISGSIGHLQKYRGPGSKVYSPAGDDLKTTFKDVVRTLKQHLIKLPLSKSDSVMIGPEAKRKLDEGTLFLDR